MAASANVVIRGTDKTQAAFRSVKKNVSGLNKSFGALKSTIAGVLGVAALGGMARSLLKVGDRIGKVSLQLGVSTNALQKFQFAAEQSGISSESFNRSLQRFARNIGEANDGSLRQVKTFERLGVSLIGLDGKSRAVSEVMLDVAESFKNQTDKAAKAKTAMDLFGRAGADMIVFLDQGKTGLENLGRQLENYGGIIDEEGIRATQEFNDEMNLLSKTMRAAFSPLIKVINMSVKGWRLLIDRVREFNLETKTGFKATSEEVKEWTKRQLEGLTTVEALERKSRAALEMEGQLLRLRNSLSAQTGKEAKLQIVGIDLQIQKNSYLQTVISRQITALKERNATSADATDALKDQARYYVLHTDGVTKIGAKLSENGKFYGTLTKEQAHQLAYAIALTKAHEAGVDISQQELDNAKLLSNEMRIQNDTLAGRIGLAQVANQVEQKHGGIAADVTAQVKSQRDAIFGNAMALSEASIPAWKKEEQAIESHRDKRMQSIQDLVDYDILTTSEASLAKGAIEEEYNAKMQELQLQRAQGAASTIEGMASAVKDEGGALFEFWKATAIAESVINANLAATKALSQLGAFGPPVAAAIYALAMVNVRKIAMMQPAKRERGGDVASGKPFIVGEAGPELFTPGRTGTITPNDRIGGPTNVNFTINAVDPRGFDQLLQTRRGMIVSMINQAMNRRGKAGVT